MTPRAILDTNVLVPVSSRLQLQELAKAGLFVGIWSPWIIAELNRVLAWLWVGRSGGDTSTGNLRRCATAANEMMVILLNTFELSDPPLPYPAAWPTLGDPDDRAIWVAAVHASADLVVSNNTHDFPPIDADGSNRWEGIEYLTAVDFTRRLLAGGFADPARSG